MMRLLKTILSKVECVQCGAKRLYALTHLSC